MMDEARRLLIGLGRLLSHPTLWRFLLHPTTRYVLAWLVALGAATATLIGSWVVFNDPRRGDGNEGHAFIDFGGQYLMGRMLVKGYGRHLYDRGYQLRVLREAYPTEREVPDDKRYPEERRVHDADSLMEAFMGADDWAALASPAAPLGGCGPLGAAVLAAAARTPPREDRPAAWDARRLGNALAPVGGPLYPPVNALYYYPLGLMPPQWGYRANQAVGMLLAFASGLGISLLSRGRLWWPVATVVINVFPGFVGSENLGQNASHSLAVLVWGWVLMSRGRLAAGGVVWGLFAFKPVWALAFFLVPVLTGRWRVCLAMAATGTVLAAATLPFVGWHGWVNWLKVGREATLVYKSDRNWIDFSRDLLGLPRKGFDFGDPDDRKRQEDLRAELTGWAMWGAALEVTVRLSLARRRRVSAFTGPGPAFLLFGAWLSCFHFMYYDVLLAALPMLLLFTEPRRYLEPILVAVVLFTGRGRKRAWDGYFQPRFARSYPPLAPVRAVADRPGGTVWVVNRIEPTVLLVLALLYLVVGLRDPPYDTFCLIGMWLWCGWLLVRRSGSLRSSLAAAEEVVELSADVGRAHERFAHEDGADAGGPEAEDVVPAADAALADETAVRRQPPG